jgi:A/G-specific adenine glycosylase
VVRVLARAFNLAERMDTIVGRKKVEALAKALIPEGEAREFNQALMELGALVCTPSAPCCSECPTRTCCRAWEYGLQKSRPVMGERPKATKLAAVAPLLFHLPTGRFYLRRRAAPGLWAGMYEFPWREAGEEETFMEAARTLLVPLAKDISFQGELGVVSHSFTRYRVTLHCSRWETRAPLRDESAWHTTEEIGRLVLQAGSRRIFERFLK